jgi:hypothetical protein
MKCMAMFLVLLALQGCATDAPSPSLARDRENRQASQRFFDEMDAQFSVADKARDTYIGHTGKEARQMLNADGFYCAMKVLDGLDVSKESGLPVRADLPVYRCIKDKDIPPICACVVVNLQLPPQLTSRPKTDYQANIDSLILSKESIGAICGAGPESCWRP